MSSSVVTAAPAPSAERGEVVAVSSLDESNLHLLVEGVGHASANRGAQSTACADPPTAAHSPSSANADTPTTTAAMMGHLVGGGAADALFVAAAHNANKGAAPLTEWATAAAAEATVEQQRSLCGTLEEPRHAARRPSLDAAAAPVPPKYTPHPLLGIPAFGVEGPPQQQQMADISLVVGDAIASSSRHEPPRKHHRGGDGGKEEGRDEKRGEGGGGGGRGAAHPHGMKWAALAMVCCLGVGGCFNYDIPGAIGTGSGATTTVINEEGSEGWGSPEGGSTSAAPLPPSTIQALFASRGQTYNQRMNQALYSVYSYPNMCFGIIAGLLVDKALGIRRAYILFQLLIFTGVALTALSAIGLACYPLMLVGRVVFGIGSESMWLVQSTTITRWFTEVAPVGDGDADGSDDEATAGGAVADDKKEEEKKKGGGGGKGGVAFGIMISSQRLNTSFAYFALSRLANLSPTSPLVSGLSPIALLLGPIYDRAGGVGVAMFVGCFASAFSLTIGCVLSFYDRKGYAAGAIRVRSRFDEARDAKEAAAAAAAAARESESVDAAAAGGQLQTVIGTTSVVGALPPSSPHSSTSSAATVPHALPAPLSGPSSPSSTHSPPADGQHLPSSSSSNSASFVQWLRGTLASARAVLAEMAGIPPPFWVLVVISVLCYGSAVPFIGIAKNVFEAKYGDANAVVNADSGDAVASSADSFFAASASAAAGGTARFALSPQSVWGDYALSPISSPLQLSGSQLSAAAAAHRSHRHLSVADAPSADAVSGTNSKDSGGGGMTSEGAASLVSLFSMICAILSPLMGAVLDRTGRGPLWLALAAGTLATTSLSLAAFPIPPLAAAVMMAIGYTIFCATLWPFVPLALPPSLHGVGYGVLAALNNCGMATVPLIAGAILDAYGDGGGTGTAEVEGGDSSSSSSAGLALPPFGAYQRVLALHCLLQSLAMAAALALVAVDMRYNKGILNARPAERTRLLAERGREEAKRRRREALAAVACFDSDQRIAPNVARGADMA